MIKQLAHINFFTDHSEDMLEFYTTKLGLKIKFSLKTLNNVSFCWYVDCGNGSFIEIVQQNLSVEVWGGEVVQLKKGNQYRHLCFEVQDIESYKKRLEEKGLRVSPIKLGMSNSKQAWITDPDGNNIELMEYTESSLQTSKQ